MSARAASLPALALLAIAPLCVLLFADGRDPAEDRTPAPARTAAATTSEARTIAPGCTERPLAYALTNDQA